MRALIVVESVFGNTRAIADAVAAGLSTEMSVDVVDVVDAAEVLTDDVDLLVVGGPTHALGLSRPDTRLTAAREAGRDAAAVRTGLREWLASLRPASRPVYAAAFDTRVARPRVPGSAARAAGRRLRRLGYRLVAAPASFYVTGTPGPLLEGELVRAHQWGRRLGSMLAARAPGRPA
jgi:hypothetical protein